MRRQNDQILATGEPVHHRLKMLDGWRAISILTVMAAHMLPLGPARWNLNVAAGLAGMAVFFTLSGFLIVSILHRDINLRRFLARRTTRIVPLAWLVLGITLPLQSVDGAVWAANLLFYSNLPPFLAAPWSTHFWSLGVEVQFYIAIALAVLIAGRRGLWLVPIAALAVTGARIATGTDVSIVTWFRVDEILAGGTLALVIHSADDRWRQRLDRLSFWPVVVLAFASTLPTLPLLNYARPYLFAACVGITIRRPIGYLSPILESRAAAYVATISYALYIFHPFTMLGWLGSGSSWVKYAKRPLCFAITFALAHLSTFYFERRFIAWGQRIGGRSGLPAA